MPTPAKTYSNAHHAVVVADVSAVCHMHSAVVTPLLTVYLRPIGGGAPCPVTFDFNSEAECAEFYNGLVAAMG